MKKFPELSPVERKPLETTESEKAVLSQKGPYEDFPA
jgi:hypothetical protein